MQKRMLGGTDLELTVIGLGTWAIGGPWEFGWGVQDDADSVATMIAAFEEGINWFDTAPIYGCGHSEVVVGRALKELGEKPIIATKCSLLWDDKRRKISCLDKNSILRECEDSLRRLDVEVIDLYQMHWGEPDEQIEEAWAAMVQLRNEGKVRYIGVSNFTVAQLDRISQIEKPASLQPPYSMLLRDIEGELLGYCDEHNIGVVAYSPMHRGLLTGKFTAEKIEQLAEDDHRHKVPDFNEPRLSANLQFVERLKPIADKCGITLAQIAIAWVTRRKEVTAAIVGARRPGQIRETVKAGSIMLEDEIISQIDELLKIRDDMIA